MKKRLLLLSAVFCLLAGAAFGQSVSGRVTAGQDGSPLPGVSVLLKGTTTGTTTDSDGRYTLATGTTQDAVLIFSFIGFSSQEVPVNNQTAVDVVLMEDLTQLNEVVVTALGIEREKKALGYSVTTVGADQITATGNTNFASALYGKAPGVKISTAPGGATSAVNVQVRGINSINGSNTQPLYVVDGIMIRNTEQSLGKTNNDGYWSDQKIRGNGILDINPADIENLTVLRGASAAALYGSEASNGVVVITTKNGSKSKGMGVEANYNFMVENVAFTPKFQNVYGPGYDRATNLANGATAEGWINVDTNGDGTPDAQRPYFRSYGQFGPKMDGRQTLWWDGTTRAFSPQPDNYKDFYETGHTSNFNVALSGTNEKVTYRLAYTRLDYKSIAPGANNYRNTFNLNTTLKLNSKVSVDLVANYINSWVHNRPESINRLTANYGGFFSRADYMDVYKNKYQTSAGYKYVPYNQVARNPAEAIPYNIRAYDLLDYLWRNVRDNDNESQDRLITSATLNYEIAKGLKFRGRFGNDFTSMRNAIERHNEYPSAFNGTTSTGSYTASQGRYSLIYTDALLTYTKDITTDFDISVMGGVQSKSQDYLDQSSGTSNGLVDENWFSLNNSTGILTTSSQRTRQTMFAYLATVNLGYKNFLYLEGTGRWESVSTLAPGNNKYFYPSVNAGFVFSDAFQLPAFFSFGKVRASYAGIANGTAPYRAPVAYSQTLLQTSTNGSVAKLGAARNYGNLNLKPERKTEIEVGLDLRVLDNKLGLDVTYYKNTITDQIFDLQLPQSTGAQSLLTNLGQLSSRGVEVGINATPFTSGNGSFRWDTRFSFAKNTTHVDELIAGMTEYTTYNGDAGAVLIKAEQGKDLGNIYAHPVARDAAGNPIVADGYYSLSSDYAKVGNVQPKAIGGFANTLTYKNFALDFMIDYRFGGEIVSPPLLYAYGVGMYESTLKYRDEANGGLPYNVVGGQNVLAPSHADAEYHDGVLLQGVKPDGTPNDVILDAASYYMNSYYWASGRYDEQAVHKNSYVKFREVSLTYTLPKTLSSKLRLSNIRVSLIGRNLFYLYRTLENLDPEAVIGSSWTRQGVDEGSLAATRSYGFSIHASF